MLGFSGQDLQKKNTCACEMSFLPLLKLWFEFKLVILYRLFGLSKNPENFMVAYSLHV